jgi:hypothetical protein
MTSEEFAQVCNSAICGNELIFSSVLKEGVNQVSQWLKENAYSLSDLPSVIGAYSLIIDQLDSEKAANLKENI